MSFSINKLIRLEDYGFTKEVVNDIYSRLDRNEKDCKKRADIVCKIFEEYADLFLNLSEKNVSVLSQKDHLFEETGLSRFYENIANYIDNSDEAKKEKSKIKLSSRKEFQMTKEAEENTEQIRKQFYKPKEQKIFEEDYAHPDYGQVLTDYKNAIDSMSKNQKRLKLEIEELCQNSEEYKIRSRQIKKIGTVIKGFRQDQIESKNRIGRLVEFKRLSPNSSGNEWFRFVDYSNVEHLEVCLKECHGDLISEKGTIEYDLNCLIKSCDNLSEEDKKILEMYRQGLTQQAIAKIVELTQPTLSSRLKTIFKKIAEKNSERKYDMLRIHWIKGKYKKCNKCNCVKFEKDFYSGRKTCIKCHNSVK